MLNELVTNLYRFTLEIIKFSPRILVTRGINALFNISSAHETVFFVIRKVGAIKTFIIVEMGDAEFYFEQWAPSRDNKKGT